jgi:hypothetical protein
MSPSADERRVFYPAELVHFLPFKVQVENFNRLVKRYRARLHKPVAAEQALYDAWKTINKRGEDDGLPSAGADRFLDLMFTMTRRSHMFLDYLKSDFLLPVFFDLEAFRTTENTLNPVELLNQWGEFKDREDRLGRQARFEAMRNFIISSEFAMIDLADPDRWVAEDVVTLDKLAQQTVFTSGSKTVYGIYVLDGDNHHRLVGEPMLTLSVEEARAIFSREVEKANRDERKLRVAIEQLHCRVMWIDHAMWYVLVDDRPKNPYSRFMKYERESAEALLTPEEDRQVLVRDARGALYVVVAEHLADDALRLANRRDAETIMDFVKRTMWSNTNMFIPPSGERKKPGYRNPDYWDLKFIGSYQCEEESRASRDLKRWREVPVEQKVTTLIDRTNEKYATDSLNHGIRRGHQVLNIVENYWPTHIYGVDWTDPSLIEDLRAHWQYRFITCPRRRELSLQKALLAA